MTKIINRKLRLLLLVLCASFAMLIVTRDADANVELISFEATAVDGGVELEWRTGSEIDTGGGVAAFFYVKRSLFPNDFAPIDPMSDADIIDVIDNQGNSTQLIEATGGIVGVTYAVFDTDDDLVPGQTYWYLLVEIDDANVTHPKFEDVTSATVGSQPTPTPVGDDVGQPTATPVVSATPTQTPATTPTTEPTSTPVPTATPTSVPTTQPPTQTPAQPTPTATTAVIVPTPTTASAGAATATPAAADTNNSASESSRTDAADEATESDSLLGVPVAAAAGQEDYPVAEPTVTPEAYDGESADQIPGAINSDDADDSTGYDSADANVIGEEVASVQELPPPSLSDNNETSGGNRAILWIGFLAALLIFAAGVFGSIIIFTRKRADQG